MTPQQLITTIAQRLHINHAEALELLGLAQEALDSTGDEYTDSELFDFALDMHEESLL